MKRIAVLSVVAALASCASAPESIKAKPSTVSYAGNSCASLASSLKRAKAEYEVHASAQRQLATDDAVSVFWIGVPTTGVFQKEKREFTEAKVASLKGQIESIEAQQKRTGC